MRMNFIIAAVLLTAIGAYAQPGGPGSGRGRSGLGPMLPGDFAFVRGEFGITNQVVQGAPYSAEAVTEVTRTLADGNRIQRTITTSVARDSEGRTRTERTLGAIGPFISSRAAGVKTVFINDPVAGTSYALDPTSRTVRQMPISVRGGQERGSANRTTQAANRKEEDLGTQVIQGVTAQGKRKTRTIAAGQVGNQRAIDVVTETWYSPDLQVAVMSKTSDPQFGETVYQLNHINRAEPDHSLFTVPSDYTVQPGSPNPGRRPAQ